MMRSNLERHSRVKSGFFIQTFVCIILIWITLAGCGRTPQNRPDKVESAPVSLTSRVNQAMATPQDLIRFEIELETTPAIELDIPEVGDLIQGFRIVDSGEAAAERRGGRIFKRRWYDLRADLEGSYKLPSVEIAYQNETLRTPQIFVEVKNPDSLKENEDAPAETLRDIKPLAKLQWTLRQMLLYVGAPLLLFILSLGAFFLLRRHSGKTPVPETIRPDQWALEALESLRMKYNLKSEQVVLDPRLRKAYYFAVNEIFRQYLERRFCFVATDLTTEEILPIVRKRMESREIPSAIGKEMEIFLRDTDLIKFTDVVPKTDDPLRLWQISRELVEKTARDEPLSI